MRRPEQSGEKLSRGGETVTKPSVEDKLAETFAGRTLDAWSWIARARAAAARAGEPPQQAPGEAEPPATDDGDAPAG
jgi:hypothetical protein